MIRQHLIRNPEGEQFLPGILPTEQHHFPRARQADDIGDLDDVLEPVGQAQLHCRHAHARIRGTEPEIRHQRELEAGAQAIAVHSGDHRSGHALQQPGNRALAFVVAFGGDRVGADTTKLADVIAGAEGAIASAGKDQHADGGIFLDPGQQRRQGLPHLGVDRVQPARIIEGQASNPVAGREADEVSHLDGPRRAPRSLPCRAARE